VAEPENNGHGDEQLEPAVQPEDFFKVLWLLMVKVGGAVTMKDEALDSVPENAEIETRYDEAKKQILLIATGFEPKKRKRGIIRPDRRIIRP
jgi:hypothetical protein